MFSTVYLFKLTTNNGTYNDYKYPVRPLDTSTAQLAWTDDAHPTSDRAGDNTHRKAINQKPSPFNALAQVGRQRPDKLFTTRADGVPHNGPLTDTTIDSVEKGNKEATSPLNY